ncbi:MAG TPA: hypothetical protein VF103_06675 [Polyangiaceae bacterium]
MPRAVAFEIALFLSTLGVLGCADDQGADGGSNSGTSGMSGGGGADSTGGSAGSAGGGAMTKGGESGTGGATASGGASGAGGDCRSEDAACSQTAGTPCCPSTSCVTTDTSTTRCRKTCSANSECSTGCCASFAGSALVCLPEQYCAAGNCTPVGGSCASGAIPCCAGTTCTSYHGPICRQACEYSEECESSCCMSWTDGESRACYSFESCT